MAKGRNYDISVDDSDVQALFTSLKSVNAQLRVETNKRLRAAAKECATVLKQELQQAAASAPAHQTLLVAKSVKVKSDRTPVVSVGGTKGVGRPYNSKRRGGKYRAPAGALLWGVEYGDNHGRFAPRNQQGYWLRPTTIAFGDNKAIDIYKRQVVGILHDAGVI